MFDFVTIGSGAFSGIFISRKHKLAPLTSDRSSEFSAARFPAAVSWYLSTVDYNVITTMSEL